MRVQDAMTRGVIGVPETASLSEALETMLRSGISALFVFDEHKALVGVLSEGDLLRRGELGTEGRRPRWLESLLSGGRLAHSYAHSHGRKVSEVMTKDIISIAEDAELVGSRRSDDPPPHQASARHQRRRRRRRHSRSDLLKKLYSALPREAAPKTDEEICAAIQAEIDSQQWTPRASIRVSAKDGEVTFDGAITDERLREGLRVIAENTPGVKAVHDRLAWIEPNSGFLIPAEDVTKT